MIVVSAHGVKTPWQPRGAVLSCWHEYIITHGCFASLVRRRRVLLWRPHHRRQRAWPGSADMPCRLCLGRLPSEKLIAARAGLLQHVVRLLPHSGIRRDQAARLANKTSPATFRSYGVFTPYTKGTCLVASPPIAHKKLNSRKPRCHENKKTIERSQ